MKIVTVSTGKALAFTLSLVTVLLVLFFVDRWIFPHYRLAYNESDSLAGFLFVVDVGKQPNCGPQAGEHLQLQMPQDAKYYTGKRLLKVAKGCPGDRIERVERIVYINGWYAGEAAPTLEDGTVLPVVESGIVPPDHYYVWASHPQSFDSRYQVFGFVHKDHVIGRARRVL